MKNLPTVRMSSAGHCPRAISAELLGYQPEPTPAWLETVAEEGKWHEERIVQELTAEGTKVYDRQLEVTLELPSVRLIGHIDGKIMSTDDTPDLLLEIKSMSQFEFDRWMRGGFREFYNYAAQITCYMEATGLKECLYIARNRNTGHTNRQVLTQPPLSICEIAGRLTEAVNRAMGLQLADGYYNQDTLECRRCEFRIYCLPRPQVFAPQTRTELDIAASRWREGKEMITRGEVLVDQARKCFEEHTRACGYTKWQHEGISISLVHVNESVTYPKAKLLKVFTREQLEPAAEVKPASEQLRIVDLQEKSNE